MPETWQDQRWIGIARTAAGTLNAHTDPIVAAILSQWQCEQPNPAPWPPIHNNPGNLTTHIGTSDLEPHTVATTPPGVGLLYVYSDPEIGATAYARALEHNSRYASAVARARANDPLGFLTDVCNAGYGTRLDCCLSIFRTVRLPAPAPAEPTWQCVYDRVNVRSGPATTYRVVGAVTHGAIVAGPEVAGGPYTVNGREYGGWIHLGPGRYTAHAFYHRLT